MGGWWQKDTALRPEVYSICHGMSLSREYLESNKLIIMHIPRVLPIQTSLDHDITFLKEIYSFKNALFLNNVITEYVSNMAKFFLRFFYHQAIRIMFQLFSNWILSIDYVRNVLRWSRQIFSANFRVAFDHGYLQAHLGI